MLAKLVTNLRCNSQVWVFQKLERKWEEQVAAASTRWVSNSSQKGIRELRNLISTINYDGQSGRNTQGSLKSIGTDHCSWIWNFYLGMWGDWTIPKRE